ncbi:MAG: hypothetical protein H0T75_16395 [Rhizobiales bacterium]|nr:hypothetical protein [Hyphomicrobiales bacterium]MDQ3558773.1 hypothetical protein [Pseudomonadota bacterium]
MTAHPEIPFRYRKVPPEAQPPRLASYVLSHARLTAPLLGSSLLFPRRFDAAVAALLERPDAAGIAPAHAFWYFGGALHLWVEPRSLQRRLSDFVADHRGARWIGASFLDAADWSGAVLSLRKSPIHREMGQLVRADLEFRRIAAYQSLLRRAELGQPAVRNGIVLAGVAEIDAYFRYCADLAASMRQHGILPRRELGRLQTSSSTHRAARPRGIDRAERDIGVAVTETGELVRHLGGKHRTAIARVLRLPRIPVEVRLVHVRWLKRQMDRTGLPAHQALPAGLATLASGGDDDSCAREETQAESGLEETPRRSPP